MMSVLPVSLACYRALHRVARDAEAPSELSLRDTPSERSQFSQRLWGQYRVAILESSKPDPSVSLNLVPSSVFRTAVDYFQVLGSVVGGVAVLVVDDLRSTYCASKHLFGHQNATLHVSVGVCPWVVTSKDSEVVPPEAGTSLVARMRRALVLASHLVVADVLARLSSVEFRPLAAAASAERVRFRYRGVGHAGRDLIAQSVACLGGALARALGAPSILPQLQPMFGAK